MDYTLQIPLLFLLYAIYGIFEYKNPVEKHQPFRARFPNLIATFVLIFVGGTITKYLLQAEGENYGVPIFQNILLAGSSAFAAIFLWDVIFYWYHRAEHSISWLWAIHQFHHADTHLNTSSSLRHIFVENPMETVLITVPTAYLLHLNRESIFLFSFLITVWLLFVHANWRLHLGKLSPILGGPQNHRIHHSALPKHQNKNFAVYFPFIDKLFGTYYAPAPDEFPPTGLGT